MKKQKPEDSMWDIDTEVEAVVPTPTPETKPTTTKVKAEKPAVKTEPAVELLYDLEGLMTDFPTATELQRFVYDQTGVVLNLKGRSNKFKFQTAMDVLNGGSAPLELMGSENPYLDKHELIPEEPLKEPPAPPAELAGVALVTRFGTNSFPHPEPEWRAQDIKANVVFRKYANGCITYEILGPIAKKAVGTRVNKYGQKQPEKIVWIDPRTGEQIIRRADGSYTSLGTRLREFMKRQRVNKSNQWDIWIDREFVVAGELGLDNPWALA